MPRQIDVAVPVPISPSELVLDIVTRNVASWIAPGGVIVGPASNEEQQLGCVSITDAGPTFDRYSDIVTARVQIRCMAHQMAECDMIGYHIKNVLHGRHREEVTVPSTGLRYLSYHTFVTAGPSHHFDSEVTWEALMFVEIKFNSTPLDA